MCQLFSNEIATNNHEPEMWKKNNSDDIDNDDNNGNTNYGNFNKFVLLKYTSRKIGNNVESGWLIPNGVILWSDTLKDEFVKELKKHGFVRDFESTLLKDFQSGRIAPPFVV